MCSCRKEPIKIDNTIIIFSIDGTPTEEVLDFAKQYNIKLTWFISAPYFITENEINDYFVYGGVTNFTYLKWRPNTRMSTNTIIKRIKRVSRAINEGHEIGGHAVGHYYGDSWNKKKWDFELDYFDHIMNSRLSSYNLTKQNLKFHRKYIKGFRAPCLSINSNMYKSLKDHNYLYDSSQVRFLEYRKQQSGIDIFPISMVKNMITNYSKKIIAMDYNFYALQCNAKDTTNKQLQYRYRTEYYLSLLNGFYNHKIYIIANHGSQWNDGAYWKAMKEFLLYAKRQKAVFWTFNDLYNRYDSIVWRK